MDAERKNFVVVVDDDRELQWLKSGLQQVGDIVPASSQALEDILGLVDMIGANIIFVGMHKTTVQRITTLIEGMLAAKPMLSVIAIGDGFDNDLVLAAMRAGARDFLVPGSRTSEVTGLVRRLGERISTGNVAPLRQGKMTAILNARPDGDTSFFATHLAIAMQQANTNNSVLLLDLGMPAADSLMFLGLESTFTFVDAVRNLRRLDATLIDSACVKHESGLMILSMPEELKDLEDISSAEVYLLIGIFRNHFTHVVVNLAGVPSSDFLQLMLNNCEQIYTVVDQSVPSYRHNLVRTKQLKEAGITVGSGGVVVERYRAKIPPSASAIAKAFDMELVAELVDSNETRLRSINLGKSMFELAPRDRYLNGVQNVARKILGTNRKASPAGLFRAFVDKLSNR